MVLVLVFIKLARHSFERLVAVTDFYYIVEYDKAHIT